MKNVTVGSSRVVGLAAVLGLAACVLTFTHGRDTAPKDERKVFKNSVIPLPASGRGPRGLLVHAAVRDHSKDKMNVLFSLPIEKEQRAKLEQKVLKGEVVDPKDLAKSYAAKQEDFDRLVKWLKSEKLEVTHTTPDRTSVYVRATVEQVERSLQVKVVRVTLNGMTYNAAQNAPSLPKDVGIGVQAIMGLQEFRKATKHARINRSASGPHVPGFLVKEVLKAYDGDGLDLTGDGQTIAILIDTFPKDEDTAHFWDKNGLPNTPSRVKKINVKDLSDLPPVEGEESMDVQWSSGVASKAKVRVYASGSLQFSDLDLALDRIIADATADATLRQVSISLGLGEQFLSPDGELDGEVAIENQKFLQLAALGVNVFVSSGDAGSNPDDTGHGSGGPLQAEWMASSPFVVGVGGTKLFLKPDGTVGNEPGWEGSGGGRSKVFERPGFQDRPGMPDGGKRLVPDVSLLAAPETGKYVRVNGQDLKIGGTSLSAPVWAGFCALINQSRTKAGKPTLPYLNPIIYPLMGTECFRDIKGGSNGEFTAGTGYDMVTGLGVPNLKKLTAKLKE